MVTSSFGPSALATPANAVTLARAAAAPLLLMLVLGTGDSWPAFLAWGVLAGTDGLDGYIARRQGTTRSGAFLDPLADKLLVIGAMTGLVVKGIFWWLPVALIALRELVVSFYRTGASRQGVSVPAKPWAKLKTLVQYVAVGLALFPPAADNHRWAATLALWAAVVLTVQTGVAYLAAGWKGARAV
jgi:CDP-diacylglycerol---glycerol-3-phosphate 3-phosphatidyltransferase